MLSESSIPDKEQSIREYRASMLDRIRIGLWYGIKLSLKMKDFLVGSMVVFIVVITVILLQNVSDVVPMVFLRMTEIATGEMDLLMMTTKNQMLNWILIDGKLKAKECEVSGTAPRWMLKAGVSSLSGNSVDSMIIVWNTTQEREIGVGREWKHAPISEKSCYLSNSTATILGLHVGDEIDITIDISTISPGSGFNYLDTVPFLQSVFKLDEMTARNLANIRPDLLIKSRFKLELILDDLAGKLTNELVNFVIIESSTLQTILRQSLMMPQLVLNRYSMYIIVMKADRTQEYLSNLQNLKSKFITWTNVIRKNLPSSIHYELKAPILSAINMYNMLHLMLNQLLLTVQIFIIALGFYLIYSLMISGLDEKIYQSLILRILGLRKWAPILLVCVESLTYGIIGLSLSLVLFVPIWWPIKSSLEKYTLLKVNSYLNPTSTVIGLLLSFLMPSIASFVLLRHSMKRNIAAMLNSRGHETSHSKPAFNTSLIISFNQVVISLLIAVFGFTVFYVVPFLFITSDLASFFTVVIAILIFMIVGLNLIATSVYQPLQILFANMIFLDPHFRKLMSSVKKNLVGHLKINKKATFLYTSSISFVIFASILLGLQCENTTKALFLFFGTDLVVRSSTESSIREGLNSAELKKYLENWRNNPACPYQNYSFITFPLGKYVPNAMYVGLSTFGNRFYTGVDVLGIDPSFQRSIFNEYLEFSQVDESVKYEYVGNNPDVFNSLTAEPHHDLDIQIPPYLGSYDATGLEKSLVEKSLADTYSIQIPAVISYLAAERLSVSVGNQLKLCIHLNTDRDTCVILVVRAIVTRLHCLSVTKNRDFGPTHLVFVSMSDYALITQKVIGPRKAVKATIPKERLFLKLKEEHQDANSEFMVGLKGTLGAKYTQVTYLKTIIDDLESTFYIVNMCTNVIVSIILILCFLGILISVRENVQANIHEFATLRALGLTKFQTLRINIYEVLCVVLVSIVLGLLIGFATSLTMSAQSNMFLDLPYKIKVSYYILLFLIGASIVFALLSSLASLNRPLSKPIASILRKNA